MDELGKISTFKNFSISGINVEANGHISTQFSGAGPLNRALKTLIKNELKNISKSLLKTKLAVILESVMKKTSLIDQLYVNVVQ